ncbi:HAD hydrolase-like protein [Lutimaribacter sp. EGI FJ00015]|uniref:HAD hydrolase-like protein n=1 Tax=Lutimaribacter degradans TaxID=2945989 RepID=A0ACC6A007_9RHOB|nr:HAD family hydrolase [Lutimaribacter sp. EGI FJ00013]MCM2563917.1 HAD hydrolase-like protein [Lutimaribacter sp. EGI FJ00013]MCO0615120.1 HAD hydrolase-like protein [Lutimaribacter sp. EGI FJ00015]MCO0637746.1 HAD hydrolase-like protein [Lutimaribacter sp. EGI FJ00014]
MSEPVRLRHFLDGPLPDRSAILADLDGCLVSGEAILPNVPELFARCRDRLWIVSNNSSDTAQSLSSRLARLGLSVPPERILLAGEMTLRALQATRPGARIALYAAEPLQGLARDLGLWPDREHPEAVVLARDPAIGFADIARIATFADAGLPVILANPDRSHPAADGTPVPETGALWAAVNAVVPQARMSSLGKPAPDLAREALRRAGVAPAAAVFIGDTAETDGLAAAAAGVEFVQLMRPGKAPANASVNGACTC